MLEPTLNPTAINLKHHPLFQLLQSQQIFDLAPSLSPCKIALPTRSLQFIDWNARMKGLAEWKRQFRFDHWTLSNANALKQRLADAAASGRRIQLEIGCGVGWATIGSAVRFPEQLSVGIDRSHTRLNTARRLAASANLHEQQLCFAHTDNLPFLVFVVPPKSLHRMCVFYPNPNPKNTHAHKRFHFSYEFLAALNALSPKGEIILTTDQEFYAEEAASVFQFWSLNDDVQSWRFQSDDLSRFIPRTAFEKKYLERGRAVYQIRMCSPRPIEAVDFRG